MATKVKLESHLDAIARRARRRSSAAVKRAAREIVAGAAERSRVDTGDMKRGWQIDEDASSTYEVFVINPVWYAHFHEFGTVRKSARPMAIPATRDAEGRFELALREAWDERART